jgi:hypothetical protein
MKLLIVETTIHYQHNGQLSAYAPYAREIDIWADLFSEVLIAAPCRNEVPPGDCAPFTRANISNAPQKETGGRTLKAKIVQAASVPGLIWSLGRVMRSAEAIHVRCPGNLGLLGALLAPLFSRYLVAKYAGLWKSYPGEPMTYRLQRAILRSSWWRGPVTVYGRWHNQLTHVVSFFTSVMTAEQMTRARQAAGRKEINSPLRVLYVGRLSKAKNVDILLKALAALKHDGIRTMCTIVGHGPEREPLETLCTELDLSGEVEFTGGVEFERVLDFYEKSDVLVLASQSEGWGKSVVEAMAFGLICIGSAQSVPEMLGEGRGIVVPPGNVGALTEALRGIATTPEDYAALRARAALWGQQFSLESLREALRQLLANRWRVSFNASSSGALDVRRGELQL